MYLVGQSSDHNSQVGEGRVDGGHFLEALSLRLTLLHSLTAGQIHETQRGWKEINKHLKSGINVKYHIWLWKCGQTQYITHEDYSKFAIYTPLRSAVHLLYEVIVDAGSMWFLHLHLVSRSEFSPSMSSWNTEWEREDWSFMHVRAVDRFWFANMIKLCTWDMRKERGTLISCNKHVWKM